MCTFQPVLQAVLGFPLTVLFKDVSRNSTHEMGTLTSVREGEASGATRSSALVGEADCEAPAAQSQALPPKDAPTNSGENFLGS